METLKFLTPEIAESLRAQFATPLFAYDERSLIANAAAALAFPNAFGLTVRYAMKASSNAAILQIFDRAGLHIDASSGHEVERALRAGIAPEKISLSTQEFPASFAALFEQGIEFNACSLSQLEQFGKLFPGRALGVRFNPGLGSGGTHKTNVGGPSSSFGIWHESLGDVQKIVANHDLKIVRIHTHIGSGSDPEIWQHVAQMSLEMVRQFPDVTTLNLGGGYKVGRMSFEKTTDLQKIGAPVREAFERLAEETGREIHLEIEPGTFLLANACALVATVQDIVHTGADGYRFLKLDAGMTEILRPSLYGSQHPIILLSKKRVEKFANGEVHREVANRQLVPYIVVGHCCESGDLLTPAPGQHETLEPRELPEAAIGDLCVIEGVGAYCASMATKNYNSFPEAPEIMVSENGSLHLIRRRQTLEQIVENEIPFRP